MSTTERSPIKKALLSVQAKITEMENEVNGVNALGNETTSDPNANRNEPLEAFIRRLKRVLQNAKKMIDDYLLSFNGDHGDGDGDEPRLRRCASLNRLLGMACCGTRVPETDQGDEIAPEPEVKKTFLQWLALEESTWDYKQEVLDLGTRLSLLVLDFFFLVSNGGDILEIVTTFKTVLRAKSRRWERGSLVAVNKFLKLLEFAGEEARMGFETIRPKSPPVIGTCVKEKLVVNFCHQILNMEVFVNMTGVSRPEMAGLVRMGVEDCRSLMNSVEEELSKLRLLVKSSMEEESENVAVLRAILECKARDLWGEFESVWE